MIPEQQGSTTPSPGQYACFTLTGSFDPQQITRQLGVLPTDAWQQGARHPLNGLVYPFSRWSLRSRLPTCDGLADHVRDVLQQMAQNPAAFQRLSQALGGRMLLVGFFPQGYLGLQFDAGLVQGLAQYGLEVDFDFYGLVGEDENG